MVCKFFRKNVFWICVLLYPLIAEPMNLLHTRYIKSSFFYAQQSTLSHSDNTALLIWIRMAVNNRFRWSFPRSSYKIWNIFKTMQMVIVNWNLSRCLTWVYLPLFFSTSIRLWIAGEMLNCKQWICEIAQEWLRHKSKLIKPSRKIKQLDSNPISVQKAYLWKT